MHTDKYRAAPRRNRIEDFSGWIAIEICGGAWQKADKHIRGAGVSAHES